MDLLKTRPDVQTVTTPRVYVVDRYPLIRRGLAELIGEAADMNVCGEAAEETTAFNAIVNLRPEVVVLEISPGRGSGLELIKRIHLLDPRIAILVLSMHDESTHAPQAMRAGARGFVSKCADNSRVLDAIRRINRGQFCFSSSVETELLAQIVRGSAPGPDSPASSLSERELEVGGLIGHGASTREIAGRLGVSVKTIETHRAHMKGKLGLRNSARLAQFWVNWIGCRGESSRLPGRAPGADSPVPAARVRASAPLNRGRAQAARKVTPSP